MTIQKVAKDIEEALKAHIERVPARSDIIQTLVGLGLLVCEANDFDCVYFNKVNTVLEDAARDVMQ